MRSVHARRGMLAQALLLLLAMVGQGRAQTALWLPAQVPARGIGAWWEMRADGTLIRSWGALAQAHYSFDGTSLTIIPGGARRDRPRYRLRFKGDRMFSRADQPGAPEAEYRRRGAAIAGFPLLGEWVSVIKTDTHANSAMADMPGMTTPPHDMPSVRTFAADGLYRVRIAYNTQRGTWDAALHRLRLDGEPERPFAMQDGKMIIDHLAYHSN